MALHPIKVVVSQNRGPQNMLILIIGGEGLEELRGWLAGTIIRVIKRDTRSLDCSSSIFAWSKPADAQC